MRKLDVDLKGIRMCVSVDDLPVHGPELPSLSRLKVAETFTDTFGKFGISGVYGFINGASTEPSVVTENWRRLSKLKTVRKLVNVSARLGFDLNCYMNSQIMETSVEYLEILNHWVDCGHFLGNHNYWHSDLNTTDANLFLVGIKRNEKLIARFPPSKTKLFRYPYLKEGNTITKRDKVREYLTNRGYATAPVTVNFNDWAWNRAFVGHAKGGFSRIDEERFISNYLEVAQLSLEGAVFGSRKLFGRDIPHILVLHFGAFTAISLDRLLTNFIDSGVRFVSMEEALQDSAIAEPLDIVVEGKGLTVIEQRLLANNEPINKFIRAVVREAVGDTRALSESSSGEQR
ncbi:MAG: polysaccharide deacetylase family protein [Candidatus Obscuribacterales bacterium]|nr:polysaccharide deacetylase family protein [Candidatus Obscuribacterales bacterium]